MAGKTKTRREGDTHTEKAGDGERQEKQVNRGGTEWH